VVAVIVTALALAAAGYAIAAAQAWASCRNYNVKAYPNAYPSCHPSVQDNRPKVMAGAGGIFLVLGVVSAYLWIEDRSRQASGRSRR
jgi:hypothetical protein